MPLATRPPRPRRSTQGLWPARRPFAAIVLGAHPELLSVRRRASSVATDPPPSPLQLACAPRTPSRCRFRADRPRLRARTRMRDPGREPALGRFRGPRRAAAAEAGADARVHVRDGQAGGGARERRRDGLLRSQLQQPRRHADGAERPGDDGRPRQPALRLRRLRQRLPDTVDRTERALRRADADAVDGDDGAVPREHAPARPAAEGARRVRRRHDREPALHGRRGGAVVARPRGRRALDPAGLLHLAERAAAARARAGTREPLDAERDEGARTQVHRDRDPGEPGRARAPVPVGAGHGRPRGIAAAGEVARDREAAGAGGPARDQGAADALDLVVGLGDVQRGGDRPGQGRGGLRVALGSRPQALQRPGGRRAGDGRFADGRPARAARPGVSSARFRPE